MKYLKTALAINLTILVIYFLLYKINSDGTDFHAAILFATGGINFIHAIINLVIGVIFYIKSKKELGNVFMICAATVFVVGTITLFVINSFLDTTL